MGEAVDAKFSKVLHPGLHEVAWRWGLTAQDGEDHRGRPDHEDFISFKYLWNDEHSDAVFWRLRGNSLQFLTVGSYAHWLLPHGVTLQPFEHYIPVQHDQSDLLEKIYWARIHDDEARRIAEAGANATTDMLRPEMVISYVYELLRM